MSKKQALKDIISDFEEFSGHTVGDIKDKDELIQRIKSIGYSMACEAEIAASSTCQEIEDLYNSSGLKLRW
jgi:hypothetical protein